MRVEVFELNFLVACETVFSLYPSSVVTVVECHILLSRT